MHMALGVASACLMAICAAAFDVKGAKSTTVIQLNIGRNCKRRPPINPTFFDVLGKNGAAVSGALGIEERADLAFESPTERGGKAGGTAEG